MDETNSDQLQFRGQDATECRNFIAALMKLAFARGKQRDDQWMADFAATCMADDALAWWSALDEEVQGSWKLLRQAMFSAYRPMFYGGSGEEAEKFIRAVCDKAIGEGKRNDNEWIVAYAESCLAGEALRWYTYLDPDTQENWKKLQRALLSQYPRGDTAGPAPNLIPTSPAALSLTPTLKVTPRRGRIRISNSSTSTPHYLSKCLPSDCRLNATSSLTDALELEWSPSTDDLKMLSIPDSQIPGYDLLGLKWSSPVLGPSSFLAFCAVESKTNSTRLSYTGALLTKEWKISAEGRGIDEIMTVSVTSGPEPLYPRWNSPTNALYFSKQSFCQELSAKFFFEPV